MARVFWAVRFFCFYLFYLYFVVFLQCISIEEVINMTGDFIEKDVHNKLSIENIAIMFFWI